MKVDNIRHGKVAILRQIEDETGNFFWDIFTEDGEHLNPGERFWEEPTEEDINDFTQQK